MTQHTFDTEPPPTASARPIALTLVGLLILTFVSWAISNVSLGWASTLIALAIAAVKAVLVVWFFMELPHASTPARVMIIVTLSFIALLSFGVLADIGVR